LVLCFVCLVLCLVPLAGAEENRTSGAIVPPLVTTADPPPRSRELGPRTSLRRTAVVDAVERVKASVVNIHSERTAHGPTGSDLFALTPSQNRINGMGTGILIDPRGYIVTNHHVVEDVNVIRVRLADGSSHSALVMARSPESDLALLKIETNRALAIMPLGTASDLMVGETVLAIGNAYGYEHTVSQGIVSAIKRDVTLNKEISYKQLIQTDASINPGNSGGPLVNINGELVGVNVAIRAGAQGIGFAIPVDSMIRVVCDMLRNRRQATFDGLVCRDRLESSPDGPVRAVVVERVEVSGPAAKAGLQRGDVVLQAGDVKVACSFDVERGLLDRPAGDHVAFLVRRQGKEERLELQLQAADRARVGTPDLVWRKLGLRLSPVSPELVMRINRQLHGGLEVTAVDGNGTASKAGISRGDILVGLHQWETLTMENVAFVLTHPDLASFNPLCFYIIRGGQMRRGWLQQVD
jgi:serine protease Do